jgi:iron complex outermembrane receptor protein
VRFDVAVGDTFSLVDERLLVQPSFRYEHLHDDFGGTVGPGGLVDNQAQGGDIDLVTPRLGLRFDWTPHLALRGNAGRYARAPNFSELFGNRGSIIGNPRLDPEKGVNADMGVVFTHDAIGPLTHLRAEATGFVSFVDDLIVLVQNSQRTSVPRNVASARVLGTEATLALDAFERAHLALNYTFQDARDESGIPARDGNHLPGRPVHSLYARAEYHVGPAQLFYELDFLASNFLDQANFREVDSRTVHTIGVTSRLPWPAFEVSLELRNLSDNQIEDVGGFPLPGRSVFGSIRWRWQGAAPQEHT